MIINITNFLKMNIINMVVSYFKNLFTRIVEDLSHLKWWKKVVLIISFYFCFKYSIPWYISIHVFGFWHTLYNGCIKECIRPYKQARKYKEKPLSDEQLRVYQVIREGTLDDVK